MEEVELHRDIDWFHLSFSYILNLIYRRAYHEVGSCKWKEYNKEIIELINYKVYR